LNEQAKPVKGSRIAVVGVSYKAGVGDLRESPALKIIELLREQGAELSYHDDYVPELPEFGLRSQPVEDADCVAIVTVHPGLDLDAIQREAGVLVDFRGVYATANRPPAATPNSTASNSPM
jgi:UDP-N-acetyl-D-glucosamine dehydrogenase